MADRKVTELGKNLRGDVTSLRGDEWWSPVSRTEAIKDIEHGKHRYFLKCGDRETLITVANGSGPRRLVTDPDDAPIEEAAERVGL